MKKAAFTLTELMIVIVIMGILSILAIPNYAKSMARSRLQDAMKQLSTLHAANQIYRAQNLSDEYLPGTSLNLSQINQGLGINIIANGLTYSYTRNSTNVRRYSATATDGTHTITLTENILSSTNPTCTGGSACP